MTAGRASTPRWAAALGLTLLVAIFPQFGIGALGPQLRMELGLGAADLGVLYLGLYAAGVVGSPVAGVLVDRIGGRRSCLGLLLVAGAALLGASVATSRTGLLLALVPMGAAMAFANPGTNRWASLADDPRRQTTLVGIAQAGVQAGALLAGLLAAAAALGVDWRWSLRIVAVVAVLGAGLIWRVPERPQPRTVVSEPGAQGSGAGGGDTTGPSTTGPSTTGPSATGPSTTGPSATGLGTTGPSVAAPGTARPDPTGPSAAGPGRSGRHTAMGRDVAMAAPAAALDRRSGRRRQQWLLAAYALAMGGGTAVVVAYLPSFAVDTGLTGPAGAGVTAIVYGAVALGCRLALGAIIRRPDEQLRGWLVLMALGAIGAVLLVQQAAVAGVWLWVGTVVFGATGTTWPALAFLGVVRSSTPSDAGRVTGWVTAAFYLGLWVLPWIGGQALDAGGYAATWAVAAGCYGVALVPALALSRVPGSTAG